MSYLYCFLKVFSKGFSFTSFRKRLLKSTIILTIIFSCFFTVHAFSETLTKEELFLKTSNFITKNFLANSTDDIYCFKNRQCERKKTGRLGASSWAFLAANILAKKNKIDKYRPEVILNSFNSGVRNTTHQHNLFQILYSQELNYKVDEINRLESIVETFLASMGRKNFMHSISSTTMTVSTQIAILAMLKNTFRNLYEAKKSSIIKTALSASEFFNRERDKKILHDECWRSFLYYHLGLMLEDKKYTNHANQVLVNLFRDNKNYNYLGSQALLACMHVAKVSNKEIYSKIVDEIGTNRIVGSECGGYLSGGMLTISKKFRLKGEECLKNRFHLSNNAWLLANLS